MAGFVNEWDMTLSGLKDAPSDAIMESLFKRQLDHSVQLKETMSLYQLEVTQRGVTKSYDKLRSIVNVHLEQRRRLKTREELSSSGRSRHANAAISNVKQGDCRQIIKMVHVREVHSVPGFVMKVKPIQEVGAPPLSPSWRAHKTDM